MQAGRTLRDMGTELKQDRAALRAPGVVVAAALVVLLAAAYQLVALQAGLDGVAAFVATALVLALYASVAYGIWRGWRGARILAVIGGGLAILGGLVAMSDGRPGLLGLLAGGAVIALLVAPQASRQWFAR